MSPDPARHSRDVETLLGGAALGDALERLRAAVTPRLEVGGWATVELDRAEVEVATLLVDLGRPTVEVAPDERVLGARCRLLRFGAGRDMVILEPSTEGRLAAALVRYGEGSVVRYLLVDSAAVEQARRAGFIIGARGKGPFGDERLVIVGPRYGPFLILAGLH